MEWIFLVIVFILIAKVRNWLEGPAPRREEFCAQPEQETPPPEREKTPCERTGCFYRGAWTRGDVLYSYRDGYVFKGANYGFNMLNFYEYTYRNGRVYNRADQIVGCYRNGYIWLGRYDGFTSDAAARYEKGYIHEGQYLPDMYVGNAIASYTGDDDGAAACAVAMLLNG